MSSDQTPRLGLPDMPEMPELYADTVTDAFGRIDVFTDLYLKGQFVNTPPVSPVDGDAYLIGGSPTGDWSGYAYKIATCRDGVWTKLTPFNGLRAYVATSGAFIVHANGVWTDWNSMISASEASIASAATCDIGTAGSLFLQVTGTTTITGLGNAANRLRFLRFAGALTLTHNATSLILPGGANIVTAAGDTTIITSDGSGNWRCRHYTRAAAAPHTTASPVFTGTVSTGLVAANVSSNGAVSESVQVRNNGTGGGTAASIGFYAASTNYAAITGGFMGGAALAFSISGAEVWRATASNIYIGTTSTIVTASEKFGVQAGATVAGAFQNDSAAIPTLGVWNKTAASTLTTYYSGASGTAVGSISSNGSSASYNTTSDARLKTVSARQGTYRNAIRALWVGDFTWNDGGAPGFGVLAQQAYEVMPNHQGVTPPDTADADWHAAAEPFAYLALWGVKDLYAMIEALTARVAVLETYHAG